MNCWKSTYLAAEQQQLDSRDFFLNVHKLWMNFINKDKQILYLTLKFQS